MKEKKKQGLFSQLVTLKLLKNLMRRWKNHIQEMIEDSFFVTTVLKYQTIEVI